MLRKIKNRVRRKRMARVGVAEEIECAQVCYGIGGGAWVACPTGLDSASVVYSFGIGRDISFDRDIIEKQGAVVHAFDPTPASLEWLGEQDIPDKLKIHQYGLASRAGEIEFFAPRKPTSAHYTPVKRYNDAATETVKAPVKPLKDIMRELGHDRVDLMKMDIEGGEYEVIRNILQERIPIGQMLVEFHHAYETIGLADTVEAVESLRSLGFKVFSISERCYEISMLNITLR